MKSFVVRLVLITGTAGVGCAGKQEASPADEQLADDLAAAELKEYHRHHHLGGATQFVAMSLDTLGEDDAKVPQVEKIQNDLFDCLSPAGDLESELLLTLADGVSTGTMDRGKIDATIAQLDTSAAEMHTCSANGLNELHGILSPGERETFSDKVIAQWQVWQEVNLEVEGASDGQRSRLNDLARQLNLTPEQVSKMSTALDSAFADLVGKFSPKETEAQMLALAAAFTSDSFDAKTTTANADSHLATYGSMRKARFYETIAPLLTPEQRVALGGQLREYANRSSPTTDSAK